MLLLLVSSSQLMIGISTVKFNEISNSQQQQQQQQTITRYLHWRFHEITI